jgi:hypothetical protein
MKNKHNTRPQQVKDVRSNEHLEEHVEINSDNAHMHLRRMVAAINTLRVTSEPDSHMAKMMTQILRAGGMLVDDD